MSPDCNNNGKKLLPGLLARAASEIGICLSSAELEKFEIYLAELKEWNKKINLTALESDRDIIAKHFVDSLMPLAFIAPYSHVLDIGSGAGFPGIPLKIAKATLSVILVEARRKKVFFLRHIIRLLDLKGIRAEHRHLDPVLAQSPQFHERFDVVISRAAFDLKTFLDLSRLLLKEKGCAIAMKGPQVQEEIELVSRDPGLRVFHLVNSLEMPLPLTYDRRRLVLYRKG